MDKAAAQKVMESDDEIDSLDIEVEEEALHAIALFQPVASDLRSVVATMSVAHELERIGDLAANIAACVLRILKEGRTAHMAESLQQARK
jgi:phosphate transport system protein